MSKGMYDQLDNLLIIFSQISSNFERHFKAPTISRGFTGVTKNFSIFLRVFLNFPACGWEILYLYNNVEGKEYVLSN